MTLRTATFSIKKDDQVQVISGREKGKTGKVLRVDVKNMRVLIEKVNLVKRHMKPTQQNPQGGISEKEQPIHVSNVLLYCAKCGKGVRSAHKVTEATAKGKKKGAATTQAQKVRVCRKCGETLGGSSRG